MADAMSALAIFGLTHCNKRALFDRLVGAGEHGRRQFEAKLLVVAIPGNKWTKKVCQTPARSP
jgi:hypothetical protein